MSASTVDRPRRSTSTGPRSVALAFAVDLAFVLLFAGIGRSSHDLTSTVIGLLETAWPFVIGLATSWLVAVVFRHPMAIFTAGLPLWVGSVVIGMLLRAATGAGTATPFILVATITLGAFLIGWRAFAALVVRLRARSSA